MVNRRTHAGYTSWPPSISMTVLPAAARAACAGGGGGRRGRADLPTPPSTTSAGSAPDASGFGAGSGMPRPANPPHDHKSGSVGRRASSGARARLRRRPAGARRAARGPLSGHMAFLPAVRRDVGGYDSSSCAAPPPRWCSTTAAVRHARGGALRQPVSRCWARWRSGRGSAAASTG
jgi:hypothetical protein